jgi:hypothetical protein
MGNWKELGVVPDSDDEVFESDDSLPPPAPHSPPEPPLGKWNNDIWEFPGSSGPLGHQWEIAPTGPHAKAHDKLSGPTSGLSAGLETEIQHAPNRQPRHAPNSSLAAGDDANAHTKSPRGPQDTPENSSGLGDASTTIPSGRDEISSSHVQILAPSAKPFLGSSLEPVAEPQFPGVYHEVYHDTETSSQLRRKISRREELVESSPRAGRSLRPRKPIQEHPYLLENAQYSRFMKSHGVKPIHIGVQHQNLSSHDENVSQGQDYTGGESQSTSGGPSEELQGLGTNPFRYASDDDVDELALSQSPRTSSPRLRPQASSERSRSQQTNDTSINGDEEFPDIQNLALKRVKAPAKPLKRPMPSRSSGSRKRLKSRHEILGHVPGPLNVNDDWDIPISPSPLRVNPAIADSLASDASSPSFSQTKNDPLRSTDIAQWRADAGLKNPSDVVDLTNGLQSDEDPSASESEDRGSSTDSDIIQRTGKTMKGVLPASWLRLDKKSSKPIWKGILRRPTPQRSPDGRQRGVATVRHTGTLAFEGDLEDLGDDDGDGDEDGEEHVARLTADLSTRDYEYGLGFPHNGTEGIDDSLSVIEEDDVDWMLPAGKRNRTLKGIPNKRKQNAQQKLFKGEQRLRQPKISNSVHRASRSSSGILRTRQPQVGLDKKTQKARAVSPPALGIADVIEPGAPRFVRVAARAATRRQDLGRSKPNNKVINLGTRKDNVDVHSILRDWTTGKIKRKASPRRPTSGLSPAGQDLSKPRQPLGLLSLNITRPYARPRADVSSRKPSNSTRQVSLNAYVASSKAIIGSRLVCCSMRGPASGRVRSHDPCAGHLSRPAQLEADALHGTETAAFTARKNMLDLVFCKIRKEVLSPTFRLQGGPSGEAQLEKSPNNVHGSEKSILGHATKPWFRKQAVPKRLDLEAPQFRHANDPLPGYEALTDKNSVEAPRQEHNKILGLGPYGTQYTHHFDIFPVQEHVFFHHSTLIGNGTLKKALECLFLDNITRPRTEASFRLADHYFYWGLWTDTTSSELGLLLDLLSDQLSTTDVIDAERTSCQAVNCADHVLRYILHSIWFKDVSDLISCAQRLSELFLGFSSLTQSLASGRRSRTFIETNTRFLICSLVLLRICQRNPELSSTVVHVEDLIKSFSKAVIQGLLDIGTSAIRATYDDLQCLATRERGIRSDNFTMTSWVVVIKVLDTAQIPRSGFWDLTYSLMGTPDTLQSSSAQLFENLWSDMFTLAPLEDFDDNGIINRRLRHTELVQGSQRWGLPQKLLKRVFESCRNNPKQSPSFNEYCHALLGRCHRLIDQWGWYKCSGIVGTIFDFFGQQSLSNLRHEQVSKSPRFLEHLSGTTSLSVEPEDRCFHIFLKILALSIRTMRKHGLSNDIRNLIARTLPNHDRHYSKEQTIHAHDLAALRNHHDLLCTLFWAAPPEERPAVHLIEELVSPGSSHKEAVLLNLRAWRQLAKFVVSSEPTNDVYRPLMLWQNRVFQQVLEQYHSAASEIQRQFMSMPSEAKKDIGQQMLDSFVYSNQTAAKDVLYFSVAASLEVMRDCPSLTSVMFSFNTSQLNKALTNTGTDGQTLDCGILRACFSTVELFLDRLESFSGALKEESNDSFSSSDNREYTDAVELLDEKVVQGLFIAVRQVLSSATSDAGSSYKSVLELREKGVVLSGRIASMFINGGKRSLKHFFSIGKYGLFENVPQNLSLDQRTYLPLFVATLLKNHIFDFSSIGCSHFDIWTLSLVKPFHAIKYELHLAETLRTLDMGYMKGAPVIDGMCPNYRTCCDLFACAVSYMRKELRHSDAARRTHLRAKYEKLLKLVMQQMRSDIKSLDLNSAQHKDYTSFIREIVGLIQSHGTGISTVDSFYLQSSAEFSPATEDPELHSAVIIGYGLRLGEGDATAGPQLFSFLCTHFKRFMADGQAHAESKIIENGMSNDNILAFVLGKMLPAIIRASLRSPEVSPLLDVYSRALGGLFGRSYLPREIPDRFIDHSIFLLETILGCLSLVKGDSTPESRSNPSQIHLLSQMMDICHAIRPSLTCWLVRPTLAQIKRLEGCINKITLISRQAITHLDWMRGSQDQDITAQEMAVRQLLAGLANLDTSPSGLSSADSQVSNFAQQLHHDLQNCWTVAGAASKAGLLPPISATQSSGQPGQVARNHTEKGGVELLAKLHDQFKRWVQAMDTGQGCVRGHQGRRASRPGQARSRRNGHEWRGMSCKCRACNGHLDVD